MREDFFKEKNDFICQECGARSGGGVAGYLEAHHKDKFIDIIKKNGVETFEDAMKCEELWDINNGITLCKNCHNKTKKGRAKLELTNF